MNLQEIPKSYIIVIIFIGLIILRAMNMDSWVTAALSLIVGYMTGKHIEQIKVEPYDEPTV